MRKPMDAFLEFLNLSTEELKEETSKRAQEAQTGQFQPSYLPNFILAIVGILLFLFLLFLKAVWPDRG